MSGRHAGGALCLLLVGAAGLWGCDAKYVVGALGLMPVRGASIGSAPIAVALGDLNGDHALDAAVLDAGTQLCTLLGHDDGTLRDPDCVSLAEPAAALGLASLRQAGRVDFVTAGSVLTTYTVGPDRRPIDPVRYPLSGMATSLLPAYVKCDRLTDRSACRQDVLLSDGGAAEVAVFFANSDGSLRGPQRYPVGTAPAAVLFADLDHDDQAELVTANLGASPLTVLGPRGVATFSGCRDGRVQPNLDKPSALAAIDLDHDGRSVLVIADRAAASIRLLRVSRTGPITLDCGDDAQARLPVAADPLALAVDDFDGDGNQDLVIAHGSPPAVSLLLAGPGGLAPPLVFSVGSAVRGLAVGDLDKDGRPDVVVASSGDATVSILRSAFR